MSCGRSTGSVAKRFTLLLQMYTAPSFTIAFHISGDELDLDFLVDEDEPQSDDDDDDYFPDFSGRRKKSKQKPKYDWIKNVKPNPGKCELLSIDYVEYSLPPFLYLVSVHYYVIDFVTGVVRQAQYTAVSRVETLYPQVPCNNYAPIPVVHVSCNISMNCSV